MVDVVSKKVTLLIKGIQDKSRLARKELSNKEIKAQELISKGMYLFSKPIETSYVDEYSNVINEGKKKKPPLAVCAK